MTGSAFSGWTLYSRLLLGKKFGRGRSGGGGVVRDWGSTGGWRIPKNGDFAREGSQKSGPYCAPSWALSWIPSWTPCWSLLGSDFQKSLPLPSGIAIFAILAKTKHLGRRSENGRFASTKRPFVDAGKGSFRPAIF